MNTRHLYRSRDDRMLAGVAGGLAELWDADPSLVRIVWAFLVILTGGIALVVYVVMALVVPDEEDVLPIAGPAADPGVAADAPPAAGDWRQTRHELRQEARLARQEARAARRAARGRESRSGPVVVGTLFVLLGTWFLVREYLPTVDWDWFWPAALIALGAIVLGFAVRPQAVRSDRVDAGRGSVSS